MFRALTLLLLLLASSSVAGAQEPYASLFSLEGSAEASSGNSGWRPIASGQAFRIGDRLRVGPSSRAAILFVDGVLLRLNANASIEIHDRRERATVAVQQGQAYFLSRDPQRAPDIETPHVTGAVRGTEFAVDVRADQSLFSVITGSVECFNEFGRAILNRGEAALTSKGGPPVKQILVEPLDAVQWALFYPPVLDLRDYSDFERGASPLEMDALRSAAAGRGVDSPGSGWRGTFVSAMRLHAAGRVADAVRAIDASPSRSASLALLHASLLFSGGEAGAAEEKLVDAETLASRLDAESAERVRAAILAQRAVARLVQNRQEEALEAARAALAISGESVSALMAAAYVEQSYFRLEESRDLLRRAAASGGSLASIRLAELELSLGNETEAARLLRELHEERAFSWYAEALRGFLALVRGNADEALECFRTAQIDNPSSGLPWLGSGLALVKRGELEAGREDIQRSVLLEPRVSVFRSYLGKALYEQDKLLLAETELGIASSLDPLDPTPDLYASYNHLALHRPIESLWSIEDSIRKNDNRAVYRSSFMLDRDLGTRSASLGQVFAGLGFTRAAELEGTKSINRDYGNYSAHYLLADNLAGPISDRAKLTELLLASLLAPVQFNAILPTPGGQASLNDYTALYDRPTSRNLVQAQLGSPEERIDGALVRVQSFDDFSYLVRYLGTHSDGSRSNDREKSHSVLVRSQYEIHESTTLLGQLNGTSFDRGDFVEPLDGRTSDQDRQLEIEDYAARLGFHTVLGPRSHLLGQFVAVRSDIVEEDGEVDRIVTLDVTEMGEPFGVFEDPSFVDRRDSERVRGKRFDAQHISDSDLVSIVTGGSVMNADVERDEDALVTSDELDILSDALFETEADYYEMAERAFTYSTWHLADRLDLTAGADYAHVVLGRSSFGPYTEGTKAHARWSPKVGLTAYADPSLTLRGVYFETLGNAGTRDLEQLEPVYVAGFSQVYDTGPGEKSRAFGGAFDYKLAKSTYAGAEYLRRRLIREVFFADQALELELETGVAEPVLITDEERFFANEDGVRAYLYQVLGRRAAFTADYQWLELDQEQLDISTRTNRLRMGLDYYDPSGIFGFVTGTWRHQDRPVSGVEGLDSESDFWIVNAGLGYQLPERHGVVTLSVRNIFDREFVYERTSRESEIFPEAGVFLEINLNG